VSYINQNDESLTTYISLLVGQEEEVIDLLSEYFEDDSRYRDVKNPVAMTWLISFEQMRVRDPLAAEILSFIACVNSKFILLSLLPPGLSRKEEINVLGALDAYAFVYKRQADSSLDVHRLVHLVTRNWLRREKSLVRWAEIAVNRLDDVFPVQNHQNRIVWRRYLAHSQFALNSRLINQEQKAGSI
jgi:MoxR-like ATPase